MPFYYSGLKKPTPNQFFKHMYDECSAAIYAMYHSNQAILRPLERPELYDVYCYMRLLNQNAFETAHFLKNYGYWENRLWNTNKWYYFLLGDVQNKTFWGRFRYPIGRKLFNWINPLQPPEAIKNLIKSIKD